MDLVPLLSWFALGGRCRYCHVKINARYPVVELACGVLFACMVFYTTSLSAFPLAFLAFILLCVAVIDQQTQEIPDRLVLAGAIAGVLWVIVARFTSLDIPHAPVLYDAALGVLAGGVPLLVLDKLSLLIFKKDGFGYGDVKLMAMAGVFLGWQLTLAAFFFAIVAAGAWGAFLLATKRARRGEYIAFGPFLCAGVLLALWFGPWVLALYSI